MIYTEYPVADCTYTENKLTFLSRGDARLSFRLVIVSEEDKILTQPSVKVLTQDSEWQTETPIKQATKGMTEYKLQGNSWAEIRW